MGLLIELYFIGIIVAGILLYQRTTGQETTEEKHKILTNSLLSWYTVYEILKQ